MPWHNQAILRLVFEANQNVKRPVSMNIGTGLFDEIVFTGLCGSISF